MPKLTKIVIVGAGFAGLQAVLGLARRFGGNKSVSLTLVEKNDYHLFSPNLCEVAASEEEFTSIGQLKKSICLPIKEILSGFKINFVKGELNTVNPQAKKITVGIKELEYDYLVLATGLVPDFLQVDGAKEYSLPLSSLPDALRIRNAIEFAVQVHRLDVEKKTLKFAIAGGGNIAVGLAGELSLLLDIIAWKNNYPREKLEIVVIETGSQLLSGSGGHLSQGALLKLNELKVQVKFYSRTVNVSRHLIEFINGERMEYNVLIWAAGVRATPLPAGLELTQKENGRIEVGEFLQAKGYYNIFVIGGLSYFLNDQNKAVPITPQNAIHQGKYLAYALPLILRNQRPISYHPCPKNFIVNIGKHWAILNIGRWYFKGSLAYLIGLLAHFNYYRSLVGFKKAFHYVFREVNLQREID
jgi:NADH dehydrogenase